MNYKIKIFKRSEKQLNMYLITKNALGTTIEMVKLKRLFHINAHHVSCSASRFPYLALCNGCFETYGPNQTFKLVLHIISNIMWNKLFFMQLWDSFLVLSISFGIKLQSTWINNFIMKWALHEIILYKIRIVYFKI